MKKRLNYNSKNEFDQYLAKREFCCYKVECVTIFCKTNYAKTPWRTEFLIFIFSHFYNHYNHYPVTTKHVIMVTTQHILL